MKRLILIDSHAIIHRAYHALPVLTSTAGETVQAVYGFTSILLKILRELKPDYIAAAFDLPGQTFRHVAYERYKAQRPETPSDLSSQIDKVREILTAFGIPIYEKEGYEADDVIGTITKQLEKNKEVEIVVVTGDLDMLQLIRPRLKVYAMKKGITETVIYDAKGVQERYGLKPSQFVDFKGLKGDPSDNIPGVKGIGEKTAADLLKAFGSTEQIYKALKRGTKKIAPALAQKLRQGEKDAEFSRELARIHTAVPIEFKLSQTNYQSLIVNDQNIRAVFLKFRFTSLLKRLEEGGQIKPTARVITETPPALFKKDTFTPQSRDKRDISTKGEFLKFIREARGEPLGLLLHEGELFLARKKDGRVVGVQNSELLRQAQKIFNGKSFYVHDAKSLIHFLRGRGIELGGIAFDTMLAAYLVEGSTRDFSYAAIAVRELGRLLAPDIREEFVHFFEIAASLEAKLVVGKLAAVFQEIEIPLIRVLADLEERGVAIDREFLKGLAKKVDAALENLTKAIYDLAGESFNLNSSQQLSRILFETLRLKTYGLRKTIKGGVISTSASELEKLRGSHPIIEKILEYRELTKLKNTYIDVLPELVNLETGRLHTTFHQTGTVTGRLSASDPNLQNIPIMSEIGREIRKAFIAEKSFVLASFDYSQIELRVAAHLASDEKMIEAFRKGMDIHALTASEVYNVPLEKVTPDHRRSAKTLNFGILYGMGSQALSESTGMSREEARSFIEEYFRDFNGIRGYIERTKKFAEENGYVETLFGRRRYIPEIQSPNWQLKREAERMAVNAPIQGSAADLVKIAMIKVDDWIKKEKLQGEVRMLLQVHDELLFEIKEGMVKKAAPRIKELMERVAELKVPLVVDAKVGDNWGEQKKIL